MSGDVELDRLQVEIDVDDTLLVDDFERGNLTRWTAKTP
jgi:hypothetical protein